MVNIRESSVKNVNKQFNFISNTRTEAWYLGKYCNPAIGKVDEIVKPDVLG